MVAEVPILKLSRVGVSLAPDFSDGVSDAGVVPDNDGNVILEALYTGDSTATMRIHATLVVAGQPLEDTVVDFDVDDPLKVVGTIPPALFNQQDGSVLITCSSDLLVRGYRI